MSMSYVFLVVLACCCNAASAGGKLTRADSLCLFQMYAQQLPKNGHDPLQKLAGKEDVMMKEDLQLLRKPEGVKPGSYDHLKLRAEKVFKKVEKAAAAEETRRKQVVHEIEQSTAKLAALNHDVQIQNAKNQQSRTLVQMLHQTNVISRTLAVAVQRDIQNLVEDLNTTRFNLSEADELITGSLGRLKKPSGHDHTKILDDMNEKDAAHNKVKKAQDQLDFIQSLGDVLPDDDAAVMDVDRLDSSLLQILPPSEQHVKAEEQNDYSVKQLKRLKGDIAVAKLKRTGALKVQEGLNEEVAKLKIVQGKLDGALLYLSDTRDDLKRHAVALRTFLKDLGNEKGSKLSDLEKDAVRDPTRRKNAVVEFHAGPKNSKILLRERAPRHRATFFKKKAAVRQSRQRGTHSKTVARQRQKAGGQRKWNNSKPKTKKSKKKNGKAQHRSKKGHM